MKKLLLKFDTRTRILASVVILTIAYVVVLAAEQLNTGYFSPDMISSRSITLIFLGAGAYLLMFWIAAFRINGERFITILGFPAIGVFVFSLFSRLIISSVFGQLSDVVFILITSTLFSIFSYILFITANILNVAHLEEIPLGQAGRAAYYVLNLIIAYLLFIIVVSNEIVILIKFPLIFAIAFLAVVSSLWTIKIPLVQRLLDGIAIGLMVTFTYFVLAIWPIDGSLISFIMSVLLYITLGVALEVREILKRFVWLEYGALFILIFLLLVVVSVWGINGPLF
jgi:hypothetical protein